MGLQQWAANQMVGVDGLLEPGARGEHTYDEAGSTACVSNKQSSSGRASMNPEAVAVSSGSRIVVPDGLLTHLAQLPHELVNKIASDAFLSPNRASNIQIIAPPPDPHSSLVRLKCDCRKCTPPALHSDEIDPYGWPDDGVPSEDESI